MGTKNEQDVSPKEYHQSIYNNLIEDIEAAVQSGELDSEEGEAYKLQALNDLQVRLLVEDGYDQEEAIKYVYGDDYETEEEDETESVENSNYSENNMATAEFNEENLNDFAVALAELIEEEYETLEDGILTVAEATGYDPDTVVTLLTGEHVPDENLVDDISQCFDYIMGSEEAYVGLQLLAAEARGEDVSEEEDEYDQNSVSDSYEENEANPELEAAYSKVDALEGKLAEFQASQVLKNTLDKIIRKAEQLKESHRLMPVEFNALLGNLPNSLDDEKVASFTAYCQNEQVPIETELYAINKVLEIAAHRGEILPTGVIANPEFTNQETQEAEFKSEINDAAQRNFELMKKRGFSVQH